MFSGFSSKSSISYTTFTSYVNPQACATQRVLDKSTRALKAMCLPQCLPLVNNKILAMGSCSGQVALSTAMETHEVCLYPCPSSASEIREAPGKEEQKKTNAQITDLHRRLAKRSFDEKFETTGDKAHTSSASVKILQYSLRCSSLGQYRPSTSPRSRSGGFRKMRVMTL